MLPASLPGPVLGKWLLKMAMLRCIIPHANQAAALKVANVTGNSGVIYSRNYKKFTQPETAANYTNYSTGMCGFSLGALQSKNIRLIELMSWERLAPRAPEFTVWFFLPPQIQSAWALTSFAVRTSKPQGAATRKGGPLIHTCAPIQTGVFAAELPFRGTPWKYPRDFQTSYYPSFISTTSIET